MGDARPPKWMRGRTPEILRGSRALRAGMTSAEMVLWNALRDRRNAGLRFRRQHAIGQFVLDFYCPARRLAIEVDGGVHYDPVQAERDKARTEALAARGIQVLRIRNEELLTDLPGVLQRIAQAGGGGTQ